MRFLFDPKNLVKPITICLPERLLMLRESNELYQFHIAGVLGLDRSSYTYYETGKSEPGLLVLAKLARLYDVNVDYLLGVEQVTKRSIQRDKQARERLLQYLKEQGSK